MRIAFIGLGTMGFPLAGHLARNHDVTVFNRTRAKAERWCAQHGGKLAATPRAAAGEADLVFTCVGNDDDLRSVVLGQDGVMAGMAADAVLVDHTTVSPSLARELDAACRRQGARFMDAPVSGGAEGARNGQLTIMCGGDADTFRQLEPVLATYAKKITRIGAAGTGQAAKMINQICVVGILESLAEGLALSRQMHLDAGKVMEAIGQGAASSWQLQHRWQSMLAGDFRPKFSVKWMAKDLDICLAEARAHQVELPATAMVRNFYGELLAGGGGELDITALLARLTP